MMVRVRARAVAPWYLSRHREHRYGKAFFAAVVLIVSIGAVRAPASMHGLQNEAVTGSVLGDVCRIVTALVARRDGGRIETVGITMTIGVRN